MSLSLNRSLWIASGLALAFSCGTTCDAAEVHPVPTAAPTAHRAPVPRLQGHGSPAQASPYAAPYAGNWNHAQQAPAFRWGWFGAEQYAPVARNHRSYYGQTMRWSKRRAY